MGGYYICSFSSGLLVTGLPCGWVLVVVTDLEWFPCLGAVCVPGRYLVGPISVCAVPGLLDVGLAVALFVPQFPFSELGV